jgi:lysozyme family protein
MTVETAFDRALAFVLRQEGGASRNPNDAASSQVAEGEVHTNYGVTQNAYDAHRYRKGIPRQSVALIHLDEVATVYLEDYWRKNHLDDVACYAPKLAMCLLDGAVQHGKNPFLWQYTVGADSDGVIGPETLGLTKDRVEIAGEDRVMAAYLMRRKGYYEQIIRLSPQNEKFRKGWRRRVNELCREVGVEPVWPVKED